MTAAARVLPLATTPLEGLAEEDEGHPLALNQAPGHQNES